MHKRKAAGFTLIEILIAIIILGVVLSTVYAAYRGTFLTIRVSEDNRDRYDTVRATMHRIIHDMSNMSPYRGRFDLFTGRTEFGHRTFPRLQFTSTANLGLSGREGDMGITSIEYLIQEDRQQGGFVLIRAEVPHRGRDMNEQHPAMRFGFPLCEKVHALNFKFYDLSGREYETWDSRSGPEAQKGRAPVMITVELELANPDGPGHPFKFKTSVYLPASQVDRETMPIQ